MSEITAKELREVTNGTVQGASDSNAVLGAVCQHGQLKRSCEICEKDAAIDRLRGQLQNCVNLLHRLKRHGYASDVMIADEAIDRANKVLYETMST